MQDDLTASQGSGNGTTPSEADSTASVQAETQTQTTEGGEGEKFFDPNQVPDELKPAYKQMQAAFTKKTQEIAQARKESEALKAKAEAYSKYEQYIPVLDEMLANPKGGTPANPPELMELEQELRKQGYGEEEIKFMKHGAKILLASFNKQLSTRDQQATLQTRITEAEALDQRLRDTNLVYQTESGEKATFGDIVAKLVAADPKWTSDPVTSTKRAIAFVDAMIGKAKTDGKQELSASATAKAAKFAPVESSPQSASSSRVPKTIHEAYEMAKAEVGA